MSALENKDRFLYEHLNFFASLVGYRSGQTEQTVNLPA